MAGTERTRVAITDPRLTGKVWELFGLIRAAEALKVAAEKWPRLPGLGLAEALLDKEVADQRSQMAALSLRQVAKAGHDVSAVNVFTTFVDGRPVVEIEPFDLVDLADSGDQP